MCGGGGGAARGGLLAEAGDPLLKGCAGSDCGVHSWLDCDLTWLSGFDDVADDDPSCG